MILPLLMASPSPMLTTILSSLGDCMGVREASSFIESPSRYSASTRQIPFLFIGALSLLSASSNRLWPPPILPLAGADAAVLL